MGGEKVSGNKKKQVEEHFATSLVNWQKVNNMLCVCAVCKHKKRHFKKGGKDGQSFTNLQKTAFKICGSIMLK